MAVCQRMVGGELVWGRRVGGGGMREEARTSTVMLSILNSAPPSKIAVDISNCMPDNQIKSCIIL